MKSKEDNRPVVYVSEITLETYRELVASGYIVVFSKKRGTA